MTEFFQLRYHGAPASPRRPSWMDAAKDAVSEKAAAWVPGENRITMIDLDHTVVWSRPGYAETICLANPGNAAAADADIKRRLIESLPGRTPKTSPAPVLTFKLTPESADKGRQARFRPVSVPSFAQEVGAARGRAVAQMKNQAEAMLALYLQQNPGADLLDIQIVTKTDSGSIRMYLEPKQ